MIDHGTQWRDEATGRVATVWSHDNDERVLYNYGPRQPTFMLGLRRFLKDFIRVGAAQRGMPPAGRREPNDG